MPEFLTVAETAALYGVSARTVRRSIDRGELRAHRIGRSVRVPRSELYPSNDPE